MATPEDETRSPPAAEAAASPAHPEEGVNPATGIIDADEGETDSAINVSIRDSLTSIRSSILNFEDENGRLYHSHSRGKYYFPHDNAPLAPTDGRVAEEHPESEVIGVDISPVQPDFMPPNCSFEIDDLEKPWTWSKQFDFIFSRTLSGSILDPAKLVDSIYNQLEPGGWFEAQDVCMEARTDDNTLPENSYLAQWADEVVDAMEKINRTLKLPLKWKQLLIDRGFEDVRETIYKWPTNTWPRDRTMKDIGGWGLANLDYFLETAALGILTNIKGWSKEEVLVLCSQARKEMRDPRIHVWWPVYVVSGRKPGSTTQAPAESSTA
ncbi:TAM domain methyltransferase [Colletotrichum salicis]|uniref:TAM domain methyltransferase n=1 Tax=Colletotrichum salicis TaxID=1209931 RepID=A0A135SG80_9PEZI|nr:TAM domain methyltransferase [Colletotrichum salicis]